MDPLVEAKLHRPPTRPEWVERTRLMTELDQAVQRPITLVAAPPGFGKTTMVAQWLASGRGPAVAAWVSLDECDNDPVRLLTHMATALERVGCRRRHDLGTPLAVHREAEDSGSGPQIAPDVDGVVSLLLEAMGEVKEELVVLLDDFHLLQNAACHRQVEFLVEHLPPRAHLMIITRADPGLRLARLRATGRLSEIRAADLAFTAAEASLMLAREHVQISDVSVRDLVKRAEGWAAGIYLATLSMSGRPDPDEFIREVSGDNRFIGDYLTEEVLAAHSSEVRDFIKAVSILDRFSAPLCDALTGGTRSAAILHDLERSNLFLIPLDERRTWFRFHHLFASVARNELEFEQPDQVLSLHGTAARWFREHGYVEEAVTHSLASGNPREAALLVQANGLEYALAGRTATVLGWLEALGPDLLLNQPASRVTAAWVAGFTADQATLELHLRALAELGEVGPLPDGTASVKSAVALIQGVFGYGGPHEMAAGARRALELETDDSTPFYAIAHMAGGHAAYVQGDLAAASNLLSQASTNHAAPAVIRVLSLAMRSLAEGERGHDDVSLEVAQDAMAFVDARGLKGMPQTSIVFSALGRAQAATGDLDAAMATVERGLVLRGKHRAQGLWGALHQLLVAAEVAAECGALAMAQDLVEQAGTRLDRLPEGVARMRERLDLVQRAIRGENPTMEEAVGALDLTHRELDVLRLLEGSLSRNEIAGELFISGNTVKTHAQAVYRKLGASSRSEAVEIARSRLLL